MVNFKKRTQQGQRNQAMTPLHYVSKPIALFGDGGIEGHALIFLLKDEIFWNFLSKIKTCCWITIHRRMLYPTKKRYPMSKVKGEATARWEEGWKNQTPCPPEMLGGLKQNLACTRRPQRDCARPTLQCLSVSCRGKGWQRPATGAEALGAVDQVVALALLEEVAINF